MRMPETQFNLPAGAHLYLEVVDFIESANSKQFVSDISKVEYLSRNSTLAAVELAKTNLLCKVFGAETQLIKLQNGKPIAIQGKEISISHSGNLVALAVAEFPIGIDLQEASPKLGKIKTKFISDIEFALIENYRGIFDPVHLLWCAKEAVFKIYGENLPFKDIVANSLELEQTGVLTFTVNEVKVHSVYYTFFENFCFALAV